VAALCVLGVLLGLVPAARRDAAITGERRLA